MKNKGVLFLGHDISKSIAFFEAIEKAGYKVIVSEVENMKPDLVINGVNYFKKENRKIELFGLFNMSPYKSLPEGTDVVKEFELIQNKQSQLSRSERKTVERIFNDNFETR